MLSPVLCIGSSGTIFNMVLTMTWLGSYVHFTDEETEAQRDHGVIQLMSNRIVVCKQVRCLLGE